MEPIEVVVPERFRLLTPVEAALLRVGSSGDGGYVVGRESLRRTNGLLSLGIATDWSFDSDFLRYRPMIRYVACDRGSGTLVHLASALRNVIRPRGWRAANVSLATALRFFLHVPPWSRRRKFVRKWIRENTEDAQRDFRWSDLLDLLATSTPIFLKMDIEGGEYELISEIVDRESASPLTFAGLCIEFHDIRTRESEFLSCVSVLLEHFAIVHLHANNCVALSGDFPEVLEITFAPKADASTTRVLKLPNPALDAPNDSSAQDFSLHFA